MASTKDYMKGRKMDSIGSGRSELEYRLKMLQVCKRGSSGANKIFTGGTGVDGVHLADVKGGDSQENFIVPAEGQGLGGIQKTVEYDVSVHRTYE